MKFFLKSRGGYREIDPRLPHGGFIVSGKLREYSEHDT
jgi:hypothetical protein